MRQADDYQSWSFSDRSFLFAMIVSVLWHLFWFLSVTIVVAPPRKNPTAPPVMVSLGRVLDDAIFRTLVESRPEISKAFYRPSADFSAATEAPATPLERYIPGDVVSVPSGRKFMDSLKDRVGGEKTELDETIGIDENGLPKETEDGAHA